MTSISAQGDHLNEIPFLCGASGRPPEYAASEETVAFAGFANGITPPLSILKSVTDMSSAMAALFNVYLHSRPDCVKLKNTRRLSDNGRIYVCGGLPSDLCGQNRLSTTAISDPVTQAIMASIKKPSCHDIFFSEDGKPVRRGDRRATVAILKVKDALLVFGKETGMIGSKCEIKRGWWAAPTTFAFLDPHDQRSDVKFQFCNYRVIATIREGATEKSLLLPFDHDQYEKRDLKSAYAALFRDAKKILDHSRGSLAHPDEPAHWRRPSEPVWPYVMPYAALDEASMAKMPSALRAIAETFILDNPTVDHARITWTSATRSEKETVSVRGHANRRVFNNKPIPKEILDEAVPDRGFAQTFSSNNWGWMRPIGAITMTEDVARSDISAHTVMRYASMRANHESMREQA